MEIFCRPAAPAPTASLISPEDAAGISATVAQPLAESPMEEVTTGCLAGYAAISIAWLSAGSEAPQRF